MNTILRNTDNSQLKASVIVENPINIQNDVLTVEGVVSIDNSVTVGNSSLDVVVSGNTFRSDQSSLIDVSGEGYIFDGKDIYPH